MVPYRRLVRACGVLATLGTCLAWAPAAVAGGPEVYRWKDDAGVPHVADRLEQVPERYRGHLELGASGAPSTGGGDEAAGAVAASGAPGAGLALPAEGCERARALVARWQLGPDWGGKQDPADLAEAGRLCPGDERIAAIVQANRGAEPPPVAASPHPGEIPGTVTPGAKGAAPRVGAAPRAHDDRITAQQAVERAQALEKAGKPDDAKSTLERALIEDPSAKSELRYALAELELDQHQYGAAQHTLESMLADTHGLPQEQIAMTVHALDRAREGAAKEQTRASDATRFLHTQSDHFDFQWDTSTRANWELGDAQQTIQQHLEDAYREVGRLFDAYPKERVQVMFYAPEAFLARFPGAHWAWGFWDGTAIRVKSALKSADVVRELVFHEYTHVLVADITKKHAPPAWLNEGLAMLVERRSFDGEARALRPDRSLIQHIAAQTRAGVHPPLSEQTDHFVGPGDDGRHIHSNYNRAYLAAVYLHDQVRMDGIVRVLREMGAGRTFDAALGTVYPLGAARFETDFDHWLQQEAH